MPEAYSLYELNERIKEAISVSFSQPLWVKAEISEIRENANGHCYLELIEKDAKSDRITVRNKATIWSFTYRMLKPYFETATGEELHGTVFPVAYRMNPHTTEFPFRNNFRIDR